MLLSDTTYMYVWEIRGKKKKKKNTLLLLGSRVTLSRVSLAPSLLPHFYSL
jgi:hypothetical protein